MCYDYSKLAEELLKSLELNIILLSQWDCRREQYH